MDLRARLNLPNIGVVRRYLKIATLLIATIGGLSAYASTKDTHRASSVLAVVPPSETIQGAPVNPIKAIDQSTAQLAVLASNLADDPAVQRAVADVGGRLESASTVDASDGGSTPGAQVHVVVTASTKAKALDGLSVAETRMEQAFGDFQTQAGVSALAKQAHLVPIVQETPTVTNPGRIRNALTTFVTILVGGLIILLLIGPPHPASSASGSSDHFGPVGPPHTPPIPGGGHEAHSLYISRTRPSRGRSGITTARGPVSDFPIIVATADSTGADHQSPPDVATTGGSTQLEAAFDQAAAAEQGANNQTAAFDAAAGAPVPGDDAEWLLSDAPVPQTDDDLDDGDEETAPPAEDASTE